MVTEHISLGEAKELRAWHQHLLLRSVQRQGLYQLAWGEAIHFFFLKIQAHLALIYIIKGISSGD